MFDEDYDDDMNQEIGSGQSISDYGLYGAAYVEVMKTLLDCVSEGLDPYYTNAHPTVLLNGLGGAHVGYIDEAYELELVSSIDDSKDVSYQDDYDWRLSIRIQPELLSWSRPYSSPTMRVRLTATVWDDSNNCTGSNTGILGNDGTKNTCMTWTTMFNGTDATRLATIPDEVLDKLYTIYDWAHAYASLVDSSNRFNAIRESLNARIDNKPRTSSTTHDTTVSRTDDSDDAIDSEESVVITGTILDDGTASDDDNEVGASNRHDTSDDSNGTITDDGTGNDGDADDDLDGTIAE